MESQREIKRKYERLMLDVATNDYYKKEEGDTGINCYVCMICKHITKTIRVDVGAIPMQFQCEKCGGVARSSFGQDLVPDKSPTIEWYRPSLKEVLKMRTKQPYVLGHVFNGGLRYREIKKEKTGQNQEE